MHKLLLSLTVMAGVAGAGAGAMAAPVQAAALQSSPQAAPLVQTVQYYAGGGYGYAPDWRYREWRRHEAYERWRRHEEWRRAHYYRGW